MIVLNIMYGVMCLCRFILCRFLMRLVVFFSCLLLVKVIVLYSVWYCCLVRLGIGGGLCFFFIVILVLILLNGCLLVSSLNVM